MNHFKVLFVFLLILYGCNSCKEKEVYSSSFVKYNALHKITLIDLDSIKNFSELTNQISKIVCKRKVPGLKFKSNETIYYLTGSSNCSKFSETACYFTPNIFTVKNDTLISRFNSQDNKPIEALASKLNVAVSMKGNFKSYEDKVKPAIIHLHIEDKFPISKTKKVLKEIVKQFKRINSEKSSDYFEYTILFEGYSISDILPPPPPKENNKK